HAFYSGTLGVVSPTTSVEEGLLWKALFAALLWIMLTSVIIRYGSELSRVPEEVTGYPDEAAVQHTIPLPARR
ncbi:MAG: hypothetical protein P8169_02555, partial [Chloroflexota bacterium]